MIYDFEVSIYSGFLDGETYSGSFEFDDSGLTGIPRNEFLSVSNISFDFDGVNYTETDGLSDPKAVFFNGDFFGLSWSDDEFSFVAGFFELGEAFFVYDIPQEFAQGDIAYTLRPDTPASTPVSTPEPTALFSLLALGATGCSGVLKKRK
ncbi:MAG: PEP-CTERM sorting domain-containing protein [Moorea sp. SIOASIH]|uniref:PEP-CTERM sorting domain-containing protein n=1 Tax=Moorena sp. SIOASIH TaxID=2607817 RepID=UPI0013B923DD|nr:PEP-CTERM sorting domain-containing protein [Moorena sp. SIOASIH]NEO41818.1 PEP-CTERM sorting domain-containing protein [Moorena sp. SIOASIH]